MRMGTRWVSGQQPPASVPEVLVGAIADVDRAIPDDDLGQPRPSWTLTWLEGAPIAELATGVVVTLDADGEAVVRHDADDEFA